MRIRQLFVDAVLGRAVPEDGEHARFFDHWTEGEPDAGRDDALHVIDVFLLHELGEALDRVLGRGFLVVNGFDLAAGNAAGGVPLFQRPFGSANTGNAGARGKSSARGEHTDLERLVLRDCRRNDAGRYEHGARSGRLQ